MAKIETFSISSEVKASGSDGRNYVWNGSKWYNSETNSGNNGISAKTTVALPIASKYGKVNACSLYYKYSLYAGYSTFKNAIFKLYDSSNDNNIFYSVEYKDISSNKEVTYKFSETDLNNLNSSKPSEMTCSISASSTAYAPTGPTSINNKPISQNTGHPNNPIYHSVSATLHAMTLTIEYSSGLIHYWNGSQWVEGELKYWNGTEWVDGAELKYWNGNEWVEVE